MSGVAGVIEVYFFLKTQNDEWHDMVIDTDNVIGCLITLAYDSSLGPVHAYRVKYVSCEISYNTWTKQTRETPIYYIHLLTLEIVYVLAC